MGWISSQLGVAAPHVGFPTVKPSVLHSWGDFPGLLLYCPSNWKHHSSGLCHDWSDHFMRHSFMYSPGPHYTSTLFTQLSWRPTWITPQKRAAFRQCYSTQWREQSIELHLCTQTDLRSVRWWVPCCSFGPRRPPPPRPPLLTPLSPPLFVSFPPC